MATPQKQLHERTITKTFPWVPLYADNIFEFLKGEDDETKQQILNHTKSARVSKITGVYRGEKIVVNPEQRMQFVKPERNYALKNTLLLEWSEPCVPVSTTYFLCVSFGLSVTGYFDLKTGRVFLAFLLSGCEQDKLTQINAIEFTEVEIELVYESDTPAPAQPEQDAPPKPEPKPEKKPETAEAPKSTDAGSIFCCHCGANLTQAKEYVVLKEVETMFPGPDIVTKYHCCPDCYDFLRKARARVLDQLSGIVDHSKVVRVMSEWFHMFVTEAESKRKLNDK